jgi:hypothetical protein
MRDLQTDRNGKPKAPPGEQLACELAERGGVARTQDGKGFDAEVLPLGVKGQVASRPFGIMVGTVAGGTGS